MRATERRNAHGGSSSPCSARECTLASKEAQDEEDEGEHVLEENEASDDELEVEYVEYQEAVAMMTIAQQRRAEVDRARQFFRTPQSSEDRKARLDKLEQKLPCARCGRLGHRKDDNDCPAKVKVVDWREQCSNTSSLCSAHGAEARALDEGVCVTPETVDGTNEDCSSKLVGELCTVSCVWREELCVLAADLPV